MLRSHTRLVSEIFAATLAIGAMPAAAQTPQFVDQPGLLPVPAFWAEKVLPLDANEDGAFDLLIVHAQGWAIPGDFDAQSTSPLQPTLLIQTGLSAGVANFANQTATYLPANLALHGKAAAIGDIDADGHDDIALAAAFGAQQPLLRKDPSSLHYLDETFRLPTLVGNCFSVEFADFDDDGDLDLVHGFTGTATWSSPGGRPRLSINNGQGVFTNESFRLVGALAKVGVQNVKAVDIDGDLDLDIIVDGKSPSTQLFVNDGAGVFQMDATTLPSSTASTNFSTYEAEWADLDGDLDIDGMLMNFAPGWKNGAVQNQSAPSGPLSFLASLSFIGGTNGQDENDFAYLDADDDGDLDVLVGALEGAIAAPSTPEKLLLNAGQFGPAFLNYSAGAFSGPPDSTLDLAVVDLDGDRRYDVISVQGEFLPFLPRYYKNVGAMDTRPPTIGRASSLPSSLSLADLALGLKLRAWIYDAIVDDNQSFVSAQLGWNAGQAGSGSLPMPYVGGYIHRASLALANSALLGQSLALEVRASDRYAQQSSLALGSLLVCGSASYGSAAGLSLIANNTPLPGQTLSLGLAGPPSASGLLALSTAPANLPLGGGVLLVDLTGAVLLPILLDGAGLSTQLLPVPAGLAGIALYAQAGALGLGGEILLSAGLKLVTCLP